MLKLDFYESGVGETTVITFPDGSAGVVDAHPSPSGSRPDIRDLLAGRHVLFLCLTHPHADHGRDLIPLMEATPPPDAFLHTVSQVDQFFYGLGETPNYPSRYREIVREMQTKWATFMIDLFFTAADRNVPVRQLRSELREWTIGDVEVRVLSPTEQTQNAFTEALQERIRDPKVPSPDVNTLSAILALRYGASVVLLGGDALRRNWTKAAKEYRRAGLPKAVVLKVPHHGAKNAFLVNPSRHQANYLDLCSRTPKVRAVLFPGDSKHPHPTVGSHLNRKAELHVVSPGATGPHNPLHINIPGAVASAPAAGKPVVSMAVDDAGNVTVA